MADQEQLKILNQGVTAWNEWRRMILDIKPNLYKADLSGANLIGADLGGTKVNKANLSLATIGNTRIGDVDLSNVSGLESTIHDGPSTIGIDTIFRSAGKIPHKFLEDAGVPDIFTKHMASLTRQAFQYYSCFISHSTKDKEFADRMHADLRNKGVRCWFAPEDIKGGEKIHRQLDQTIRFHDKVLLILSEKSINSDWVANKIRWARKREKQEGKQKLFPVTLIDYEKLKNWELFDADTATDLAAKVRSYFIPDFTNWKDHNIYLPADLVNPDRKRKLPKGKLPFDIDDQIYVEHTDAKSLEKEMDKKIGLLIDKVRLLSGFESAQKNMVKSKLDLTTDEVKELLKRIVLMGPFRLTYGKFKKLIESDFGMDLKYYNELIQNRFIVDEYDSWGDAKGRYRCLHEPYRKHLEEILWQYKTQKPTQARLLG